MIRIVFALLIVLFACSGPETRDSTGIQRRWSSLSTQQTETLKKQATTFDQFLRGELSPNELEALQTFCRKSPERNVFCFSVRQARHFESKLEAKKKGKRAKRVKTVRPRFRKGKLTNWQALRYAPIRATLRVLPRYRLSSLNQLKTRALNEPRCPNHVAISIASTLEDYLPNKSNPLDIAQLYEKGAQCYRAKPVEQRSFLVRSGLFYFKEKKYKDALRTFTKASSLRGTFLGRALYWRYRTELELKKTKKAEKTRETLVATYPFAFHSLITQTTKKQDPGKILEQDPHQDQRRSFRVPTINLLIEQVEILHHFGYEVSASTVLEWAAIEAEGAEPEVLIYLAELERQPPEKIALLAGVLYENPNLISKETMELYFPKNYFPIFEKHSSGVDPYLLIAIARQESAFNPNAVSGSNAVGLLQILPKTARTLESVTKKDLKEPNTNIKLGARYFQKLLKELKGQVHLALAAYNAGPNRIPTWLERYPVEEPILFIDLIPYKETREYVGLVLRNYYWYRRLNTTSPEPLQEIF